MLTNGTRTENIGSACLKKTIGSGDLTNLL